MTALSNPLQSGIRPPTDAEVRLAKESSRRLGSMCDECDIPTESGDESPTAKIVLYITGHPEPETLVIPLSALRVLAETLAETARGNAVSLIAIQAELTSTQAADLLNVSRPYLCKLLDNGEIPHRKVGRNRRVRLVNLMDYKRRIVEARRAVLDELAALGQELKLGY